MQAEKMARSLIFLLYLSTQVIHLSRATMTHPDQDTSKRGGRYFVPYICESASFLP